MISKLWGKLSGHIFYKLADFLSELPPERGVYPMSHLLFQPGQLPLWLSGSTAAWGQT
jgi:hypothetical protein